MSVREEGLGLRGQFTLIARDADGHVKAMRDIVNTITDAGEDEVAQLLVDTGSPTAFSWIAIGLDSTAAADSQTQLVTECTNNGGTRVQDGTTATSNNVATVNGTFTFTGDLALKEIGLFNASTDGDMLARQVFSVINVGNGDSLEATWNITCGTAR